MLEGAAQLNTKLVALSHRLESIPAAVAKESVDDVAAAVKADIGDTSMSGWRRGKPIEMRGMVDKVAPVGQAWIVPYGRTAGPLRVMESGRNAHGGAGGFQGPGVNRSTGRTSARARATGRGGSTTARRYNGQTRGKQTWTDAHRLVKRGLPSRSSREFRKILSSIFRGR